MTNRERAAYLVEAVLRNSGSDYNQSLIDAAVALDEAERRGIERAAQWISTHQTGVDRTGAVVVDRHPEDIHGPVLAAAIRALAP